MALYTPWPIWHLAADVAKPMDIFGGRWQGHTEKIIKNWACACCAGGHHCFGRGYFVGYQPCGSERRFCADRLAAGQKIILKGNHDLWWETASKMHRFLDENGFTTIDFLHNNCFFYEKTALCGTRRLAL